MTFRDLGLCAPILSALAEQGYEHPSPIQEKAIPPALEGRDVLGCAQTGTGKTCAFAAPILQRLSESPVKGRPIRSLILTPTRELAIQIGENFSAYGKHLHLRHTVIFGGVGQNPQVEALKRGVDILVATPGRLMDLHDQGFVSLEGLEIFVLDEADRMLDMGFIHDVRKILKWLPAKKQTMLFSATMPPEIADLVSSLLHNPARVAVNPVSSPVEAIRQWVYPVDKANKTRLLAWLMEQKQVKNALVFTRTKHGANKVARDLVKEGISAAAIHGNKSQTARQQALADFKAGRIRCLVATDIAARGLDIEELSHVFNYNLPEVPETYVHRIGRTGRAGRGGEAIAFCDFAEQPLLREIEKLTRRSIPKVEDHPFPMEVFEAPKRDKHGRIINEEDAEARAAAREKRRARDEEQKAAAREERLARQERESQALQALEEQKEGKSKRRRRKKIGEVQEAISQVPESTPVPSPEPVRKAAAVHSERPKLTRSGHLMDTGDSMPRTEFHRPNPLDSDVIMDATARLLAPRRPAHTSSSAPARSERSGEHSGRRRKKKDTQVQAPKAERSSHSAPAQPKQSPAPKKTADRPEDGTKRRKRSGGRREPDLDTHRRQPKDSTEQPSLMKPYYLDMGR